MKQNIITKILTPLFIVFGLYGCSDFEPAIELSLSLDPSNSYKAGAPINFMLSGNSNIITFYSGEASREYQYIHRTELEPKNAKLVFTLDRNRGISSASPSLELLISRDFPGITQNFTQDSAAIRSANWEQLASITTTSTSGVAASETILLNQEVLSKYYDQDISIAFHYSYPATTSGQWLMSWKLYNLELSNSYDYQGKESYFPIIKTMDAGFQMIDLDKGAKWKSETDLSKTYENTVSNSYGEWYKDASNKTFVIPTTISAQPSNNDYLISKRFRINNKYAVSPDRGVVIKNIQNKTNSFTYTFEKAGTYNVTFVGTTITAFGEQEVVRSQTITIEP